MDTGNYQMTDCQIIKILNILNYQSKQHFQYMRIKITFELYQKPQILPLNYKYPLSSWIYKTLARSNAEFTQLLHQHGYQLENGKSFKLFTFSDFQVPRGKWKILGDRMKIWADQITLQVSFLLPDQMQHFVTGLFNAQKVQIGDEISQLNLRVARVETKEMVIPERETYTLKWLSPIFLSKKIEGRKHPLHIAPHDDDYNTIFSHNLIDKYRAHCRQTATEPKSYSERDIRLKSLHKTAKSVKQTIKAAKQEQTAIRAFKFDFELEAPPELIEIGLNAGFGAENAQGFGCCELMSLTVGGNRTTDLLIKT